MKSEWFAVDRAGLGKILRRRGIEFAVFELIQNAWDEEGVTTVDVTLAPDEERRGHAVLKISDDAPGGFKDLSHAFTLFADSAKKGQAEKRGRFNLGEKLVLALCDSAAIYTTTGSVRFSREGRKVSRVPSTVRGSDCFMRLKMNREEIAAVEQEIVKLIPPGNIKTIFNGRHLETPQPLKQFEATLPTEIADAEGALRKSRRSTIIRTYPVASGQAAMIYEMGIPVVEHDCAFHCDVMQKVPLTLDRENVSPGFLRALRTAVFNAAHDQVTAEQATAEWTQTAIESPDAKPEAVRDYMTKRFGANRVSFDMSDPEANSKAVASGYTLVHGGMLSGAAWKSAKEAEAIVPAGQVFLTHPGSGLPFEAAEMTSGMREVEQYAKRAARIILGYDISVKFGKQPTRERADWGHRELQFNVRNLGAAWFNLETNQLEIDNLIIHEFGHHYATNHLSEAYYDALTIIGAKFAKAARKGFL